jgi:hypothetical protein
MHIHVVPALLIKWLTDPDIHKHDPSSGRVIQSGGQRLQPEIGLLRREPAAALHRAASFGMAEGPADIRPARRSARGTPGKALHGPLTWPSKDCCWTR